MMRQAKWQTTEEAVRGIASLIFGQNCSPGRVAGVNFDGIIKKNELETIAIEITREFNLDKVREGIVRLTLCRQTLSAEGTLLRGYIVLNKNPTNAMLEAAQAAKLNVLSVTQLSSMFFEFTKYKNSRISSSFGSSIDPITGNVDDVGYVQVSYERLDNKKSINIKEIADILLSKNNVILLGEYGSGKSRCIRELFSHLSDDWAKTYKFPFAVNLRECWGLERSDEIIRRAMYTLGEDALAPSAVRAFNAKSLILLLDGFDELGSQSWSTEEGRLRQLRALALKGVKDLLNRSDAGCLIAGREHYFSSNEEMMSALGLSRNNTIIIKSKDEFTQTELEAYFDAAGLEVDLPTWLPRRPLICQTIALLTDEELESMFGTPAGGGRHSGIIL